MTTIINAATSGGLIQTADTSGILQLQTASTAALTVNASQNVGIGTASPASVLDIASSNSGMTITNTGESNKKWRVGGGSGGSFQITEAGVADRLTINTSGNVQTFGTISVGNVTPATSGAGITFPATQQASSDANTLDDYEEGTWTPTAVGGTSAGTTTYVARAGNYTKIGNIATATCYIVVSGMTGTGNLLISLPFVANENYNSMGAVATYNLDWPQAGSLVVWAVAGFAYVRIHVSADNTADAIVQTENAAWEATFTITYQV
jgi:hypothetical protein